MLGMSNGECQMALHFLLFFMLFHFKLHAALPESGVLCKEREMRLVFEEVLVRLRRGRQGRRGRGGRQGGRRGGHGGLVWGGGLRI